MPLDIDWGPDGALEMLRGLVANHGTGPDANALAHVERELKAARRVVAAAERHCAAMAAERRAYQQRSERNGYPGSGAYWAAYDAASAELGAAECALVKALAALKGGG